MKIDNKTTALVVTDPQNDFLSEDGAAWGLVGDSVRKNNTIANLEALYARTQDAQYRHVCPQWPSGPVRIRGIWS